ncbi:MAG: methanogenesis marker protein Mmp4/MtxX [Methanomicrobiaceae archaeon]|nr:methanogenesis marker protein Mmp4/MtxX [Methanomicrobiaceae archaeon]
MIVGIGAVSDAETVISAIAGLPEEITLRLYLPPGTAPLLPAHAEAVSGQDPGSMMVSDLAAGRIDAAVRGTLPASSTLSALKEASGVDHLERVALLETAYGVRFLLAPVGVDEGWTVAQKVALIAKAQNLARRIGIDDSVAVLSGGRIGDIGRQLQVDRSLADGELVARLTSSVHAEILIEDAVGSHGVIIAPDGISGNLIFRTLVFIGNGAAHGAPVVNIDKIFVDSSRASLNYSNAILLAASLANYKKSY